MRAPSNERERVVWIVLMTVIRRAAKRYRTGPPQVRTIAVQASTSEPLESCLVRQPGRVDPFVRCDAFALGSLTDAEDAVAEVFLIAWRRLDDSPALLRHRRRADYGQDWLMTEVNVNSLLARDEVHVFSRA
jgi:hypothetical protein